MSYIGNTSTTQAFTSAVDFFNGNGSTTAFTLSRPVASVAQVQAVISNVPQKPGDAFTVSGNTITFTSAPPSGTQNIYVYYTSPITQVIAPGQNTVSPASLSTGAPSWDTSGNVTTTGTINNLTVGRGAGSVSTNTAVGASALAANTTGSSNTAVGNQALISNTTASGITAVGNQALSGSNTGNYNNAFGTSVLAANTSGTENNGFGFWALLSNTTGIDNSAFGEETLRANTTGSYNTAYGAYALRFNTTANSNTAVGYKAGYSQTTGGTYGSNTFIGSEAGRDSTTGDINTFVGAGSGYLVTTGARNTILGAYSGNQGGLDIRTASNYIVLSDGVGNPRQWWDNGIVRGGYLNSGLTFTDNFNSYITPGFYRADPTATNAPSAGNYWAVIVTGNASNVVTQLASPLQSSTLWVRSYNAAWSAWTQL